MHVTYSLHGDSLALALPDDAELHELARDIEEQLRSVHTELAQSASLPVRVADQLLNALADDRTDVDLGELTSDTGPNDPDAFLHVSSDDATDDDSNPRPTL